MSKIDLEFILKDGHGDVARAQRIIDREADQLKSDLQAARAERDEIRKKMLDEIFWKSAEVDRLRAEALGHLQLIGDQADQIEKLRAEVERLKAELSLKQYYKPAREKIKDLQDKLTRAEAALEVAKGALGQIALFEICVESDIAREALAEIEKLETVDTGPGPLT